MSAADLALTFGALAPSLRWQVRYQGFKFASNWDATYCQRLADAVALLYNSGAIGETAKRAANRSVGLRVSQSVVPIRRVKHD